MDGFGLYEATDRGIAFRRSTVMTMAKAITAKESPAQRLIALTTSLVMTALIIDLVSLLIGGVLTPLRAEW